jgi:hypothetical protein
MSDTVEFVDIIEVNNMCEPDSEQNTLRVSTLTMSILTKTLEKFLIQSWLIVHG